MTKYRNFFPTIMRRAQHRMLPCRLLALSTAMVFSNAVSGQTMKAPDITRDPTLYVVPYAHLDTQWRWEMPQTISEYLLKTMRVNFNYIDKYPHYVFNWTGSNRYRLMKEYFPDDYTRLTQYVAARPLVSGRLVGGRGGCEPPQRRRNFPPGPLRQRLLSQGFWQGEHGVHAAGLLWIPRLIAQHSRSRRTERILHPEAQRSLAAGAKDRRPRLTRAHPGRDPLQRWPMDWA